jgi:uncharacterized protein YcaQ
VALNRLHQIIADSRAGLWYLNAMAKSSDTRPIISNAQARGHLLASCELSGPVNRRLSDRDLLALVERLGFVQVDSINTLARAHHHILFSRNQTYRPDQLTRLIETDASLFENWTHDASIIPSRCYPYWRHRFARERPRLAERWQKWGRAGFEDFLNGVVERIRQEGPLMARDFGKEAKKASGGWWNWHPEKTALEFLWRTGQLAISRREGFQKVYDLTERVLPQRCLGEQVSHETFVDWKCRGALERLAFATPGEIAGFWGAITPAEAATWCRERLGGDIVQVEVESADGSRPRPAFALSGTLEKSSDLAAPPSRIRALSPFDPLIRDRARTKRTFNFEYRIEVFVPAAKRRYGYYVFPLLEGDRFIGRIDMKNNRDAGKLEVGGLWLEPNIRLTRGRRRALEAELERIGKFVGASTNDFGIAPIVTG